MSNTSKNLNDGSLVIAKSQVRKALEKYETLRKANNEDWFHAWLDYCHISNQYELQQILNKSKYLKS